MTTEQNPLIERLQDEADQARNDGADDIARLLDEAVREMHNLNWALGTTGFEKMATPEEQAEHEAAMDRAMANVERFTAKAVRFCPECGSLGEVPEGARDCCPDGSHAAYMPEKTAAKCAALFRDAQLAARVPDVDDLRDRLVAISSFVADSNHEASQAMIGDTLAMLSAAPSQQAPHCATCNDNGLIGGPSYYVPDEGGVPCPDCSQQAPVAQGEPVLFMPPIHPEADWHVITCRNARKEDQAMLTVRGWTPLYTHPQQASEPMTENEIWESDAIMEVNADAQIGMATIVRFVRAVERHHQIKGKQ